MTIGVVLYFIFLVGLTCKILSEEYKRLKDKEDNVG